MLMLLKTYAMIEIKLKKNFSIKKKEIKMKNHKQKKV